VEVTTLRILGREMGGMLGSPAAAAAAAAAAVGLDAMNGAADLKYPSDCYSPKFGDSYKGNKYSRFSL